MSEKETMIRLEGIKKRFRTKASELEVLHGVSADIKKGEVFGIIEAMKLLNEVEADQDGVVKAFAAENGQPVEFGQPLVYLE